MENVQTDTVVSYNNECVWKMNNDMIVNSFKQISETRNS